MHLMCAFSKSSKVVMHLFTEGILFLLIIKLSLLKISVHKHASDKFINLLLYSRKNKNVVIKIVPINNFFFIVLIILFPAKIITQNRMVKKLGGMKKSAQFHEIIKKTKQLN